MDREAIVQLCQREVLDRSAALFGAAREGLRIFAPYEGCQNLVYACEQGGRPLILRISCRPDRSPDQIRAELHFVNYLGDHGVGVARALPSVNGELLETITAGGVTFSAACFERGRGMRVPDNHYRYREGVPIDEYFRNWGQVLGRMHALAKGYQPPASVARRSQWFETELGRGVVERVPERLPRVREKLEDLLAQLHALPPGRDSYGLIHGDFNDGNFTVDYDNGDITVFDFDDCCYFWFVYELACAWEGGVGRTMFRGLAERKAFMEHYMEQVLEGYCRENTLEAAWLERLPLFLRVVQMQELLHYARYIDEPDEEIQGGLRYKIRCIEEDVPYLGFFAPFYSPERPFALPPGRGRE